MNRNQRSGIRTALITESGARVEQIRLRVGWQVDVDLEVGFTCRVACLGFDGRSNPLFNRVVRPLVLPQGFDIKYPIGPDGGRFDILLGDLPQKLRAVYVAVGSTPKTANAQLPAIQARIYDPVENESYGEFRATSGSPGAMLAFRLVHDRAGTWYVETLGVRVGHALRWNDAQKHLRENPID